MPKRMLSVFEKVQERASMPSRYMGHDVGPKQPIPGARYLSGEKPILKLGRQEAKDIHKMLDKKRKKSMSAKEANAANEAELRAYHKGYR